MAINPEEFYQRKKKHHRHRHSDKWSLRRFKLTWERDKKMIVGIILLVVATCFCLFGPMRGEIHEDILTIKAILSGAPDDEISVDVLNTKPEEQAAKMRFADSIAALQQVDSLQQELKSHDYIPVYRPPKSTKDWYLPDDEHGSYDKVRRSGR